MHTYDMHTYQIIPFGGTCNGMQVKKKTPKKLKA